MKEYPPDPNRLLLDEAVRGGVPERVPRHRAGRGAAGRDRVSVLNGTQGQNATLGGRHVRGLQQIGFELAAPQDADDLFEHSVVLYAPASSPTASGSPGT